MKMKTLCLVHEVYNARKGSRQVLTIPFEDILDKKLKEWTDWNNEYSRVIDEMCKGSYSKLFIKYIDNENINKQYYIRKDSKAKYANIV